MRRTQEEICAEVRRRRDLYREKKRRQKRILLTTLPVVCLAVVIAGGLWKIVLPGMMSNKIILSTTQAGSYASADEIPSGASSMDGILQDTPDEALSQPTLDGETDESSNPAASDPDPVKDCGGSTEGMEGDGIIFFENLLISWGRVAQMSLVDDRTGKSATVDGTACQELLEEFFYPVLLWTADEDEAYDSGPGFAKLVLTLTDGGSLSVAFYDDGRLTVDTVGYQTDGEGMAQINNFINRVLGS